MNTLREAVDEYLSMRRHLGFKLHQAGRGLFDFVTFMEQHQTPIITQALALAWAQQPSNVQPSRWAARLGYVRVFARYRQATDPRTEVPSPGLLPFQPKRAKPYLYSDEEIRNLLRAALDMAHRYRRGALLPWVYYCLFGLLCVSGLRLGEAQNLKLRDVDLDAALLTVREAKFGRTPPGSFAQFQHARSSPSTLPGASVIGPVVRCRRTCSSPVGGNRLDGAQIHRAFYALSRQTGLRGEHDRHGPRLHDFRHRFATRTLVRWYRSEKEPERLLPVLSAYLGHVHIADTQWYLESSPELMREAMRRLENRWEDRS